MRFPSGADVGDEESILPLRRLPQLRRCKSKIRGNKDDSGSLEPRILIQKLFLSFWIYPSPDLLDATLIHSLAPATVRYCDSKETLGIGLPLFPASHRFEMDKPEGLPGYRDLNYADYPPIHNALQPGLPLAWCTQPPRSLK